MKNQKTRCSKCLHAKNKGNEEPCNKCNEIQYSHLKYENYFVDGSKNLMASE